MTSAAANPKWRQIPKGMINYLAAMANLANLAQLNSTHQTARDWPGLDQLQHLGTLAVAPTLTVQQHQDAASCGVQIAPFGSRTGCLIVASGVGFQLGAIVS
jgi:hypothetical protein